MGQFLKKSHLSTIRQMNTLLSNRRHLNICQLNTATIEHNDNRMQSAKIFLNMWIIISDVSW